MDDKREQIRSVCSANAVWKCFCFEIGCSMQRKWLLLRANTGLCFHHFIRNLNLPILQHSSFWKHNWVGERPSNQIILAQLRGVYYPVLAILSATKTPHNLQYHFKRRGCPVTKCTGQLWRLAQHGLSWALQWGTKSQVTRPMSQPLAAHFISKQPKAFLTH